MREKISKTARLFKEWPLATISHLQTCGPSTLSDPLCFNYIYMHELLKAPGETGHTELVLLSASYVIERESKKEMEGVYE